jgi:hypothetical protein
MVLFFLIFLSGKLKISYKFNFFFIFPWHSFLNPAEEEKTSETKKDEITSEHQKTPLEEVLSLQEDIKPSQVDTTLESLVKLEISKDPSKDPMPPPVLAEVVDLLAPALLDNPVPISQEKTADLQEQLVKAQAPLQLVIVRIFVILFILFINKKH